MPQKKIETKIPEEKHKDLLKLHYNEEKRRWQIGDFEVKMVMTPTLTINGKMNVNSFLITVINQNYSRDSKNFSMSFDSVGSEEDGSPILHTKFSNAYEQLEKNKCNLERCLGRPVDISVLLSQKPIILEFEKRADGRSPGNEELHID